MTDVTLPIRRPSRIVKLLAVFFDAIGPAAYGEDSEVDRPPNLGMISLLCLDAAIALLLIALGQGLGRRFEPTLASLLYWGGLATLVVPFVVRASRPRIARGERLFLLVILGEALFVFMRLYEPSRFYGYDEFLHWITAYDILDRHQLFLSNHMLPVSPYYPALEMVTANFGSLAHLDVFPAACVVVALLRAIFVCSLFLFIERITSSRIAAITCLIYMAASTFVTFHALYSYESMGVALVVFMMWWETKLSDTRITDLSVLVPALAVLGALAITHHASAMVCFSYIFVVMMIEGIRRGNSPTKLITLAGVGALAFGFVMAWEYLPWNPVRDYLSTAFMKQLRSLLNVLSGEREARVLFESAGGQTQPIYTQFMAISGVLLLCLCLATGFFRALTWKSPYHGWWRFLSLYRRDWGNSRVVILAVGALGYPTSVLFRFSGGWEIGDRMASWVYISVGLVIATALIYYWESLSWWRRSCTNFIISFILIGGLVLAVGPHAVHGHFEVNADEASIETMGISTAKWTKEWLGSGNNIASDRVNQLLLATYGDQNVITNVRTVRTPIGTDVSYAFFERYIDRSVVFAIQRSRIQYLEVDLRNTLDAPTLGAFFEIGERHGNKPMNLAALLKYDTRPEVSRVYDNGYLIIYNVGRIQRAD